MKAKILLGALCLGLLAGCANRYVITLNGGSRITSLGKPKLVDGAYQYKDAKGRPATLPAGRVREIAPESMGEKKKSFGANPP